MVRRSLSASPPPRSVKRPKFEHLTKEDFKNGVFLAPMVRSGALPTRLFALKHGATLVWSPETVDKAILHAKRDVDPVTGVISYNGVSRAIFTTHPVEKPYLIFQIGSADPELAVQAARTVMEDVSGVDLNCGCPKPFSTHAGMGAALLTSPDLLCSILTALRNAMPPEITVSAKIRLLPSQEDTLKLVERIINTGVSCLTVHCRTRNMRDREPALIERLREIVDFVEGMGKGVAVVENGDCTGWEDARRVREATGAHSIMIARGAESNPTCFSETPLQDLERVLWPSYLRLARYLDNYWGLTKFCIAQFKGQYVTMKKSEATQLRKTLSQSKSYDSVADMVGNEWTGEEVFQEIVQAIKARPPREHRILMPDSTVVTQHIVKEGVTSHSTPNGPQFNDHTPMASDTPLEDTIEGILTPEGTQNPEPPGPGAPFLPSEIRRPQPAIITGHDALTPTPTPGGSVSTL
ncbi:hypothetical protein AMATHDRAFT_76421 [Amanita thiersii Skay4041]|uniref:DUS-like FMN-binding domain-containing protein n=1 Tax=Amanita thiersii Skay4041 TaxID=703135 RepID=A0A2A9NG53_9AGAR|nr:hypothetical protein AMATHDRAFT_76421 [Amanita thiersii Skay4041]